ncbi:UDP-N-acetylglucosamine 2-epimerase (non-hydrolyzing) [Halobacteriovorax sp. JY17]|uniref:non-hydrolyzing UDP-N-acetylglucosamine 2-epimerase n=1 Tax=Halobacteriovorax sp. JY17 TaxID=2014617 RepID=UPI000C59B742|nr:UDP-N-acetylglucosamine 2-epimerase (non-hydrolyzing) [Halobacteriovorax sp. JY17]PIK14670.1 MAG: UDP-N-acetylglucosamine 2-epimerase (non-hydrolyzing) [Halobacteriovorax sp. JY17]
MKKKKILFVFGTRPEAIKMAPLVLKAQENPVFDVKVCVTGQHREMLDQVLNIFNIKTDFDLNLMKPNQTLNNVTVDVVSGLDKILKNESFHCVLVHGDTSTTMASSMTAFHSKIPVAHIEAGLRTHNINSPWPEEMNRRVAGLVSTWHFAPTQKSAENLIREGVSTDKVFVTGNTVIDALSMISTRIDKSSELKDELQSSFKFLDNRKIILVTGHRRENFGDSFLSICKGLKKLALSNENIQIVYPVHLNPNVQKPVNEILSDVSNIFLIDPQEYIPFIYLMKKSFMIITDSGGVQEEAPSLGKPVLVMRSTTERPEALEAGTVKLVGSDGERIFKEATSLLDNQDEYNKMKMTTNPYGDGLACDRILEVLNNEIRI